MGSSWLSLVQSSSWISLIRSSCWVGLVKRCCRDSPPLPLSGCNGSEIPIIAPMMINSFGFHLIMIIFCNCFLFLYFHQQEMLPLALPLCKAQNKSCHQDDCNTHQRHWHWPASNIKSQEVLPAALRIEFRTTTNSHNSLKTQQQKQRRKRMHCITTEDFIARVLWKIMISRVWNLKYK